MSEAIEALIEPVVHIALEAGEAILRVYATDFSVEHKPDRSPVTIADRAAHAVIGARLGQLTPAWPRLSEEGGMPPFAIRKKWERYWLIDPLDGTKEFIRRNGEFTVNIALVENHVPVLGVVYAPAIAVLYFAGTGVGAWKREGGDRARRIHVAAVGKGAVRIVGSRSHANPALMTYAERVGAHELVSMGSSLKLCLVAEGAADVYPRLGPTSEWDTAAAQAVVENAGGAVVDTSGTPLRYNAKDDIHNPHFIAYGDGGRDWTQYL